MTEEILLQDEKGKITKISSSSIFFMGLETLFVFILIWIKLSNSKEGIDWHPAIGLVFALIGAGIYWGLYSALPRIMPLITAPLWGWGVGNIVAGFADMTWAIVVGVLFGLAVFAAHKAGQEYLKYRY